ncbi:MAG: hypothetical protein Kow0077_28750 [Anaerolineae bacterium]
MNLPVSTHTLTIEALGGLRFTLDSVPVEGFQSRSEQALLVYLVSTAMPQSRAILAELLWPERDSAQSMANLRRALSNLRKLLPDVLHITRQTVSFAPECEVVFDVARFEQRLAGYEQDADVEALSAALGLYHDGFLKSFTIDSADFEDWALLEQERLHVAAIEAFDALIRLQEIAGEYKRAVTSANRLLQHDPLREQSHRHLMRLLVLSGDRRAALAHFELLKTLLDEEYGLPPEPETEALIQRIRSNAGLQSAGVGLAGYLPVRSSSFVGRRAELRQALEVIAAEHTRLLSIVGLGGAGKSRLALEVAHLVRPRFADGVYWVDLTAVDGLQGFLSALAAALGYVFTPGAGTLEDQVCAYLGHKHALLVLDNVDRLGEDVTPFIVRLLRAAANMQIIITSRQELSLRNEHILMLRGLSCPPDASGEDILAYDAVQLFVQRTSSYASDFAVDGHEDAIVAICRRVDGLPLGLELAASWLRVMPVEQIAHEVLDLMNRYAEAPERHSSLRGMLEDTWRRLPERFRTGLMALTVFDGGFTQAAAEAVNGVSASLLASLVNRSLLELDFHSGRYKMHPLIAEFAGDQLGADEVLAEQHRARHESYYVQLLHDLGSEISGEGKDRAFALLARDMANIRLAWQRAISWQDYAALQQAAATLAAYYAEQCWYDEAIAMFGAAADAVDLEATPEYMMLKIELLLHQASAMMNARGYGAREVGLLCEQIRDLCLQANASIGLLKALVFLVYYYATRSQIETADECAAQYMRVAQGLGDADWILLGHELLNVVCMLAGRLEAAVNHANHVAVSYDFARHHVLTQFTGIDPFVASMARAALCAWMLGCPDDALDWITQAHDMARRLKHPLSVLFSFMFMIPVMRWLGFANEEVPTATYLSLAEAFGFGYWAINARFHQAHSEAIAGDRSALVRMAKALEAWRGGGSLAGLGLYQLHLAQAREHHGQIDQALKAIQESIAFARRTGEALALAEAQRMSGTLLAAQGDLAGAEAAFEEAIATARRQRALMVELRATVDLVGLWRQQGRGATGGEQLRRVVERFTQGYDAPDMQAARLLLMEMSLN